MEKKIATSVDLLINIDRFEHLQVTKYAETKITYENDQEMIEKEDKLTNELINDVIRTLRSMPNKMGQSIIPPQKMEAVAKMEDKIGKKMPSWLVDGEVANIANTAKKNYQTAVANNYVKTEDNNASKKANAESTDDFLSSKPEPVKAKVKVEEKDNFFDDEDLFK